MSDSRIKATCDAMGTMSPCPTPSDGTLPSDEQILESFVRHQQEIEKAWHAAEKTAKRLVAQTGGAATDIRFNCGDSDITFYHDDSFNWTSEDSLKYSLERDDVEESTSDEDWEELGADLEHLATLTYPSPGEVDHYSVRYCEHDLALFLYGV